MRGIPYFYPMENNLTYSEKMLLLAIRPGKGGISAHASITIDSVCLGALILELTQQGKVKVSGNRIHLVSGTSGNPIHQYLLDKISARKRPGKINYWLSTLSISRRKIRTELYASLAEKREIRLEERRFLFFRWKAPLLATPNHSHQLVTEVKNLLGGGTLQAGAWYLLALIDAGELWFRIYPDREQRKKARGRVRLWLKGNAAPEAAEAAVTARAVRDAIASQVAARKAAMS